MVTSSGSVTISLRSYLSINHLNSAALFARKAYQIEKIDKKNITEENRIEHKSFIIGSILSSAAFLEAKINELYSDATESHLNRLKGLDNSTINLLAKVWKHDLLRSSNLSTVQKYELALDLAEKEPIDKGASPYQDVSYLIILRNALIHYKPETIAVSPLKQEDQHDFERKLKGRFKENPLTGEGNRFYPDKCLGHGCAAWSVENCISFVDEFCSKIGIIPIYENNRSRLSTT